MLFLSLQSSPARTSGPNRWMYYCHVQSHSDSGMKGLLRVLPPA